MLVFLIALYKTFFELLLFDRDVILVPEFTWARKANTSTFGGMLLRSLGSSHIPRDEFNALIEPLRKFFPGCSDVCITKHTLALARLAAPCASSDGIVSFRNPNGEIVEVTCRK